MTRLHLITLPLLTGALLLLQFARTSPAAELTLKIAEKEPPQEIDSSIRPALQSKAIQLLDGDRLVFEFWFRAEISLKAKPESAEKALQAIPEAALFGVVAVHQEQRDYKDNEFAPGIYTMRFGLQPQDGDHLGTSDHPYFAVLIPAKTDTKLEGISSYKPMVKASGKVTASGHPAILSLRPASSEDGEIPKLNEPIADHKSVRVKVPAKVADKDEKASLVFELVYFGKFKS